MPVALPTRLAEPVSGRLEAAGATFRVRPGSPSHCRCSLLRACCYAKLAARRCRVGPIQPLLVPRAGIPTCSESPQSRFRMPLSRPSPSFVVPFFWGSTPGIFPKRRSQMCFLSHPCSCRDLVPERCLQMRAGSPALPDARLEAGPASQQVPGTSRAALKQKGSLQNHLQADKRRDGTPQGAFPNPGRSPPRGFLVST